MTKSVNLPSARLATSLVQAHIRYNRQHAPAVAAEDAKPKISALEIARRAEIPLDDWQVQFLTGGTQQVLLLAARQVGKLLRVDTPIATPAGWTTMGALRVGDTVFDANGSPVRVRWVSEVVRKESYTVRFDDGAEVVAGPEHLWSTLDAAARRTISRHDGGVISSGWWEYRSPGGRAGRKARLDELACGFIGCGNRVAAAGLCSGHWQQSHQGKLLRPLKRPTAAAQTLSTEAMMQTLRTGPRGDTNHSIPTTEPLQLGEADLLVDPYVLGVWLADGSRGTGNITKADEDAEEIVEFIREAGYRVKRAVYGEGSPRWAISGLSMQLLALGVREQKQIPQSYLRASIAQRRALMAGLMDCDGTTSSTDHNVPEFDTTSRLLADGFYELAVSLGCAPRVREGRAVLRGKDCGPKWMITFLPTFQPFRLERKARHIQLDGPRQSLRRLRYVTSIEPAGETEMQCIEVESPSHLYLAGRAMVPTHNSTCASILAIESAMNEENSLQIILSPSDEQSKRFFASVKTFYGRVGRPVEAESETMHQLTLENGSRIIALSSNPKTVRGLAAVRRIFIDEAAFVSDELYLAVRPMLAISHGDMIAMSTPNAESGWFYEAWKSEEPNPAHPSWLRYMVTAEECPRYTQEFLADERRKMPKYLYEREYECRFTAPPGQLFPTDLVMGAFNADLDPMFDVPADAQGVLPMQPSWVSEEVKPLFSEGSTELEQMERGQDSFDVWTPGE